MEMDDQVNVPSSLTQRWERFVYWAGWTPKQSGCSGGEKNYYICRESISDQQYTIAFIWLFPVVLPNSMYFCVLLQNTLHRRAISWVRHSCLDGWFVVEQCFNLRRELWRRRIRNETKMRGLATWVVWLPLWCVTIARLPCRDERYSRAYGTVPSASRAGWGSGRVRWRCECHMFSFYYF
jgi:hypothetical protein